MPPTIDYPVTPRMDAALAFCRQHNVAGSVSYGTIWVRTHGEADDLTTLLAREWDSVYPQPLIGVHPVYGVDSDNADSE
jgi:hypothetical protein